MIHDFATILEETKEIGFVERVISYLVYVDGLPDAHADEVVLFESGAIGKITSLTHSSVEVLSFAKNPIQVGERVVRTGLQLEIPVGDDLLGKTISPLGQANDPTQPMPPMTHRRPIDILPPDIKSRVRITHPCLTGVTLVDRLIPIGKGQRELIIGDQKTGKTRFALRALVAQVKQGSIGVYAGIGKGKGTIRQVEAFLGHMGVRNQTINIISNADDAPSVIYLTPYSAMTIAEYFRDQGREVFIVLDDLSVHAKSYREIALTGRRFPGRNAYPGDIFYTHARLLERAGNFSTSKGETAITCFTITEAAQGDFTGYIQTNTIAMTDGHILFDHLLFAEGRRPAINPFLSVTRVGKQTQTQLDREIGRALLGLLTEAEKFHRFASFGAELGEHIHKTLAKEAHILEYLDQTAYDFVPPAVQIYLFGLIWSDQWQGKTRIEVRKAIQEVIFTYEAKSQVKQGIDEVVRQSKSLSDLIDHLTQRNLPEKRERKSLVRKRTRVPSVIYDA